MQIDRRLLDVMSRRQLFSGSCAAHAFLPEAYQNELASGAVKCPCAQDSRWPAASKTGPVLALQPTGMKFAEPNQSVRTLEKDRSVPDLLKTGEKAPFSGVYKAIHAQQHVETHYVTVVYGDTFPLCLHCLDRVQFELAMSAVYVHAHRHFDRSR